MKRVITVSSNMVDTSASGQVLHGRALPGPAARLPGGVGPHRRVGRHARGPQQGEAALLITRGRGCVSNVLHFVTHFNSM